MMTKTAEMTVVLIEDSPMFLGLLTAFLEHTNPGLVRILGSARNGEEGLDVAARLRPQAAIVDLKMPGLSGLEVISRLRARDARLAIVALTSADPDAFRAPALGAGADEFVSKETMNTDLLPALDRALQARGTPMTGGEDVDA